MITKLRSGAATVLLVLLLLSTAGAQQGENSSGLSITYELGMSRPTTHLYEVTMTLANVRAPQVVVQFPVWVPGAYRVVDAARNIQEFRAATATGQLLPAVRTQTNEWTIQTRGAGSVRLSYKAFANDIGVSGMHLDDSHAYFNGALLFPYVVGAKDRPVTLIVNKPARWTTISTGLDPLRAPNTFAAPDYDTFIDAPFEIGTHRVLRFDYRNTLYEIAVYGNHNFDTERIRRDVAAIVRSQVDMMGGAPFKRYVFIYHMIPEGRGGLEHLNSTTINRRKWVGNTVEGWEGFWGVTSHEFFHLWNVKRMRPAPLGPFDYARQVPTTDLYVSEGMTSYYGDLHLLRSGLYNPERYLKAIASQIQTLQRLPGRRILTLEESSITTWFRPDDPENTTFSYYNKGELIGMLLDLEIRQRTRGQHSLDDVFRYLYQTYGLPKPGWPAGGFQRAVEQVAGSSFEDFFTRYVSGTEELPYERVLGYAGLRLERRSAPPFDLGVTFADSDLKSPVGLSISAVNSESPAYNVLAPGDLLLAVRGERVTQETFAAQLAQFKAGETVPLAVFRGDRLLDLTFTMVDRPTVTYAITEDPAATPEQKTLRQSWYTGR